MSKRTLTIRRAELSHKEISAVGLFNKLKDSIPENLLIDGSKVGMLLKDPLVIELDNSEHKLQISLLSREYIIPAGDKSYKALYIKSTVTGGTFHIEMEGATSSENYETVLQKKEMDENPALEALINEIIHYVGCCREMYIKKKDAIGRFSHPVISTVYDYESCRETNKIKVCAFIDNNDYNTISSLEMRLNDDCISEFSLIEGFYWIDGNRKSDYEYGVITKNDFHGNYKTLDRILVQKIKQKYPEAHIYGTDERHTLYITVNFENGI